MRCCCGYSFAEAMRACLEGASESTAPSYQGYAVIRDEEFPEFVQAAGRAASPQRGRAKASVAEATQSLVGSMMRCPACGCLVLLEPGSAERVDYLPR